MDYTTRLTRIAAKRAPSAIRKLMPLLKEPGMISLGGGLPNPTLFPFRSLKFDVANIRTGDSIELSLDDNTLGEALQYSPTPGIPSLLKQLYSLQQKEHGKSVNSERSICVSTGSQDLFCKTVEMLVECNGSILVDDPCYSGALAFLRPYGCNIIGVRTDSCGIVPDALECILSEWCNTACKPRVLYTVPTASNPSGCTLTRDRRIAITAIAEKHDIIILEDDPYWFLHQHRYDLPSLLSLDRSGRVIRYDSFSKIISSGLRIGFATGPASLIERLNLHTQSTNLHTSGISQAMTAKLLQHWGVKGFDAHTADVASFYDKQCEIICESATKYLNRVASWCRPSAGMFLWLKLHSIKDTQEFIETKALAAKIVLVSGQAFCPRDAKSCFVRASFSTATSADIDTALQRLSALICAQK